jgi:hypothetical protein
MKPSFNRLFAKGGLPVRKFGVVRARQGIELRFLEGEKRVPDRVVFGGGTLTIGIRYA